MQQFAGSKQGRNETVAIIERTRKRQRRVLVPTLLAACCLLAVASCGKGHAAPADSATIDSIARVRQDSINRAQPGYIVDSILPMDEQLRRFRKGLGEAPATLHTTMRSRDQLVRSFMQRLEAADTAGLARLTITRAEFAYLIFPDSPLSAPPYAQAPDLAWMQYAAGNGTGLERLLRKLGGSSLGFRSVSCAEFPKVEGKNRIWGDCTVRFSRPGESPKALKLFASIVEREGRFKILSYDNAF